MQQTFHWEGTRVGVFRRFAERGLKNDWETDWFILVYAVRKRTLNLAYSSSPPNRSQAIVSMSASSEHSQLASSPSLCLSFASVIDPFSMRNSIYSTQFINSFSDKNVLLQLTYFSPFPDGFVLLFLQLLLVVLSNPLLCRHASSSPSFRVE